MESLSRPHHTRNQSSSSLLSKKLSVSPNGFSAKNAYDDVFFVPPNSGASTSSSRFEDYLEIFGGSEAPRASSIPFLDLSALEDANGSANARSSRPDFSKIFGGFRDDDIAVPYEEIFVGTKRRESFSEAARTPAKTMSPSERSDHLKNAKEHQRFTHEASNHSFDDVEKFNVSYNKSTQRRKGETNLKTHVSQLHAVPGFTCFVDENIPLQKAKCGISSPARKSCVDVKFREGTMEGEHHRKVIPNPTKEQKPSERVIESRNGSHDAAIHSDDKLFTAYNGSLNTDPRTVSPPSSLPAEVIDSKGVPVISVTSKCGISSPARKSCADVKFSEEGTREGEHHRKVIPTLTKEQKSAEFVINSRNGSHDAAVHSDDKLFTAYNGSLKAHPRTISSPSSLPAEIIDSKGVPEISKASKCGISSPARKSCSDVKFIEEGTMEGEHHRKVIPTLTKEQRSSECVIKSRSGSHDAAVHSDDKLFTAYNGGLKTHPCTISPQSSPRAEVIDSKGVPEISMTSKLEPPKCGASMGGSVGHSPTYTDEELDINSAAAASADALRKAIERAQESIRIAKESMERNKLGLRNFAKSHSKIGLDVKGKENEVGDVAKKVKEKNAKRNCEKEDSMLKVDEGSGKPNVMQCSKMAPDLNRATMIEKESAEECEAAESTSELSNLSKHSLASNPARRKNKVMHLIDTYEYEEKDMKTVEIILERQEMNVLKAVKQICEGVDVENKLKVKLSQDQEEHSDILKSTQEDLVNEENVKREVAQEDEKADEKQNAFYVRERHKEEMLQEFKQPTESENSFEFHGRRDVFHENHQENFEGLKNENMLKTNRLKGESGNRLETICEQGQTEKTPKEASGWLFFESKLKEFCKIGGHKEKQHPTFKVKANERMLDNVHEVKVDIDQKRQDDTCVEREIGKNINEDSKLAENENLNVETETREYTEKIQNTTEAVKDEKNHDSDDSCNKNEFDCLSDTREVRLKEKFNVVGASQEATAWNDVKNERDYINSFFEVKEDAKEPEPVKVTYELKVEEVCKKAEAALLGGNLAESKLINTSLGLKQKKFELDSNLENGTTKDESEENRSQFKEGEIPFNKEEKRAYVGRRKWFETGKKMEASQPFNVFNQVEEVTNINEEIETNQYTEKNEENFSKSSALEEEEAEETVQKEVKDAKDIVSPEEHTDDVEIGKKLEASEIPTAFKEDMKTVKTNEEIKTSHNEETKETVQREVKVENEHLQKIDEATMKERKREIERMAVERAIREARERAFSDARERAERAAAEKVAAEACKRVMTEAREKFEKASAGNKSFAEKTAMEAKLKAERAAVERATAEVRERALEKAKLQKTTSEEKFGDDKLDNGIREGFFANDTQGGEGNYNESAQRRKARLERHQRIMERAEKALAEKNGRDLLAQKEQTERNRIAEAVDADVKRWSSGKEGNLRALLSTLQYILGPDSGWQPVSLTEIITTNAVKKAYRKSTLYVHPDKLQQRGASIQHKFICEKVFDLLKAAWNKFNSEER